jgi:hypothetical protein
MNQSALHLYIVILTYISNIRIADTNAGGDKFDCYHGSSRQLKYQMSACSPDKSSDSIDERPSNSTDMDQLVIGNTTEVTAFYSKAFKDFQQLNCRHIAKAFIKFLQPSKQVKHPYNGGAMKDPEKTKPTWWPACVKHKEPDHLKMEGK